MSSTSPLPTSKSRNYNKIRIASILFLLVLTSILVVNISISRGLKYDASAINLSGRQRMLSQNIAKNTKMVEQSVAQNNQAQTAKSLTELRKSFSLFDQTLKAFVEGGVTKDATGNLVTLKAVTEEKIRLDLERAQAIWAKIRPDLQSLTSSESDQIDETLLARLGPAVAAQNMTLLKLMNNLTVGLDEQSQKKSSLLEYILLAALAFVLLNFFYIVSFSLSSLKKGDLQIEAATDNLRQNNRALEKSNAALSKTQQNLSSSNHSLEKAMLTVQNSKEELESKNLVLESLARDLNRLKEESDKIFSSVDHGLCLLTPDFKIGKRISKATYEIFEKENLSGLSFLDLMRPLITDKDLHTLESYLKLQFNGKTLPQQLDKFNPLKNIEMTLNWDGNSFINKYVGFEFERVMHENTVELLLVTVTDVTKTVALQKNLEQAKVSQEKKSQIILEILQVDPSELTRVVTQSERTLDEINALLQEKTVSEEMTISAQDRANVVQEIFRKIHNIKGNASMAGLTQLAEISHAVEKELADLRQQETVTGEELLSALIQLSAMRELIEEYNDINDGLLKNRRAVESPTAAPKPEELLHTELEQLAQRIAAPLGKRVFVKTRFSFGKLSEKQLSEARDIFIQLTRNSVVHGIETTQERLTAGKLEEGLLYLSVQPYKNERGESCYQYQFRDDGAGLDVPAIAQSALEKGLVSEEDLPQLSPQEVVKFIFNPGFSTQKNADEHAGRGVGLDLVKQKIVQELGGKLALSYRRGQYTEFTWHAPQSVEAANFLNA